MSDISAPLAAWLAERWGTTVTIPKLDVSTAGARRHNVLFEAHTPDRAVPLVATISPTPDIEITDMVTEAEVRALAREHGVRVPEVIGSEADRSIVGGSFFVSELIEGDTVPRRVLRRVAQEGTGELIVSQLGEAFAKLHAIDPALAPPRLVRPKDSTPVAAALEGLRLGIDQLLQPEPAFSYAQRRLEASRLPEPERVAIIHTDVRNGNIIVGADGLRAILDWEGAHVGDPMEDVAWVCTRMWRFGEDHHVVGGLGDVDTLRKAYEAAGGAWDEERFHWWRALTTLRWGTGLAGQAAQHLDGRFRNIVMAASGRRVAEMAYDALLLLDPR